MPLVALKDYKGVAISRSKRLLGSQYFEITHETSARWGSHFEPRLEYEASVGIEGLFRIAALMWGCSRGDGCWGVGIWGVTEEGPSCKHPAQFAAFGDFDRLSGKIAKISGLPGQL